MTKSQVTNSKQIQNSNIQYQNCLEFKILDLDIVCCLVLGTWDLFRLIRITGN
jgi:hypothetical protein